jgi:hypothetical protein
MSYLKIYPKRIIATQNADGVFGYGNEISLDSRLPAECQALLSDPQTSGGLLITKCWFELTTNGGGVTCIGFIKLKPAVRYPPKVIKVHEGYLLASSLRLERDVS